MEMLALLTKPDAVDTFVLRSKGQDVDVKALWATSSRQLALLRRAELGFVHQAGGLYPFLRCRENIALPLLLQGYSKHERDARVEALLDFLGLEYVANQFPEQLSYGERQRTAIARALIHRPSLLLADEPTSSLDPDTAKAAMQLLCEGAKRTGASLLVVSHDHALLHASGIPTRSMSLSTDSDDEKRQYILDSDLKSHANSFSKKELFPTSQATSVNGKTQARDERTNSVPFWFPWYLAWRDYVHEYALSFCAIVAFAAALIPLMVLGGLQHGVVTTLTKRFLNNPSALGIQPYGTRRYVEEDIVRLGKLPHVAFIVPQTRTLAGTVIIPRKGRPNTTADVVPTQAGDPLLMRYASVPGEGEAVITQELARALPTSSVGSSIDLVVTRRLQGKDERVSCSVRIVGVIPDAADWKAHVYLPLPDLLAMERYRDGFAVPERGWEGEAEPEKRQRTYAGFRMYVQNPEAVLTVRDALKEQGIDAWSNAREVETIQGLKNALSLITLLVGGATLAGMAFSLASLAVANVRRKARLIAQGYLMGLERRQILGIPLIQMAITALFAVTCSFVFYAAVAQIIHWAASPWLEAGERACELEAIHCLALYGGAFVLSLLCGICASLPLLSLQPAEVLRREN